MGGWAGPTISSKSSLLPNQKRRGQRRQRRARLSRRRARRRWMSLSISSPPSTILFPSSSMSFARAPEIPEYAKAVWEERRLRKEEEAAAEAEAAAYREK